MKRVLEMLLCPLRTWVREVAREEIDHALAELDIEITQSTEAARAISGVLMRGTRVEILPVTGYSAESLAEKIRAEIETEKRTGDRLTAAADAAEKALKSPN